MCLRQPLLPAPQDQQSGVPYRASPVLASENFITLSAAVLTSPEALHIQRLARPTLGSLSRPCQCNDDLPPVRPLTNRNLLVSIHICEGVYVFGFVGRLDAACVHPAAATPSGSSSFGDTGCIGSSAAAATAAVHLSVVVSLNIPGTPLLCPNLGDPTESPTTLIPAVPDPPRCQRPPAEHCIAQPLKETGPIMFSLPQSIIIGRLLIFCCII